MNLEINIQQISDLMIENNTQMLLEIKKIALQALQKGGLAYFKTEIPEETAPEPLRTRMNVEGWWIKVLIKLKDLHG